MAKGARRGGGDDDDALEYKRPSGTAGRVLAGVVLGFMALGGGFALYDAVFPDLPSWLDVTDRASFARLTSGKPALVVCDNRTVVFERVGAAMNKAAYASGAGVATYRVDCAAVPPGSGSGSGSGSGVHE